MVYYVVWVFIVIWVEGVWVCCDCFIGYVFDKDFVYGVGVIVLVLWMVVDIYVGG